MKILEYLNNVEPARMYMGIRILVYILAGAGVSFLDNANVEEILGTLAVILGVDISTTEATRNRVSSPRTAADLASKAFVGQAGSFIEETVRRMAKSSSVTKALVLAAPLGAEYAQSKLTDEMRREIQRRIHMMLRNAGLLRKQNVGPSSLLVLIVLAFVLTGCTALQDFTRSTVDRVAGDVARLTVVEEGLRFHPGNDPAFGVQVDILADEIHTIDERCEQDEVGAFCPIGDVAEPTTIELHAEGVTSQANYRRSGSGRVYVATLE